MVAIHLPSRFGGTTMEGVVERVCRDIFDNVVEVTLDGCRHVFREPEAIVQRGTDIVFLYGDIDEDLEKDAQMFKEAAISSYEGSLHDHLRRTARSPTSQTTIKVGAIKKSPSCRWRHRLAVS